MKQRLGVAFGILHNPELLILDEPTSGMDPVGRVQMREILLRIHETQKTTIFLSSHLLDEIQKLCNYVVIISKGRTLREGYVDDILASQQEKYEIRVPDEFVEKTKQVIGSMMFMVKSFELSPRGMIRTVENGSGAAINETLVKAGIPVSALIPVECSLEEAFISLTNDKNSAFLKKEPSYTVRDLSISNTPEKTQIPEQTQTLEMHQIQTLEGLQEEAKEFVGFIADQGADQCGFCNPGFVMNTIALLRENPDPTDDEIRAAIVELPRSTGVFGEPAGVTAFAGFKKHAKAGDIKKAEKVVVVITGNGLKDIDSAISVVNMPQPVAPDSETIEKHVRSII